VACDDAITSSRNRSVETLTQRDEPSAALTPGEEALAEVEALLCVGDVHEARRMLAAARRLAGPTEIGRFDALDLQLARRERVLGPLAAFEDARSRGDWVAARGHAARAAELAEGEDAAAWRHTKKLCSAWIRAEWRLSCFEVDVATEGILADCAGGLDTTDDVPACLLAEDGNTLALVSAHERWVFFREVDVAQRRVRRLG